MTPNLSYIAPRLRARLLSAGLAAACALAAGPSAAAPIFAEQAAPSNETSPYGAYLAGLWAETMQSPEDAAGYYRAALELDPENVDLLEQAFHATLLAGDWAAARPLGERALEADPANSEARMALAADAMARSDWPAAIALLEEAELQSLDTLLASVMLAWAYVGEGDEDAALAALVPPAEQALWAALVGLHQAMILDRAGDRSAESALRNAMDAYILPSFATREYGRYMERRRRANTARDTYEARLEAMPADTVIREELERLQRRRSAPRTAPNEAVAIALYGAAEALLERDASDRPQTYLVLAAHLDEEFANATILLGRIMALQGRLDPAAAMFESAVDDPALGLEARINLAELEAVRGDTAAAEAMLRELWTEGGDQDAALALIGALNSGDKWSESEALLTELMQARADDDQPEDWNLLYNRAIARERQGDWAGAEADFRAALALNAEDPGLLNYLGYAMVDRGENLAEGLGLIQRAVALQPRSGAIVDSLGWAHYRLGDFPEAVEHLERAVALDPGAADINDHLGDAYWRVGRTLEARYQWERALTFQPDDTLRAAVQAKLRDGLPAAAQPPAVAENR